MLKSFKRDVAVVMSSGSELHNLTGMTGKARSVAKCGASCSRDNQSCIVSVADVIKVPNGYYEQLRIFRSWHFVANKGYVNEAQQCCNETVLSSTQHKFHFPKITCLQRCHLSYVSERTCTLFVRRPLVKNQLGGLMSGDLLSVHRGLCYRTCSSSQTYYVHSVVNGYIVLAN